MNSEVIIQNTEILLSTWAEEMKQPEEGRLDVYLPSEKIVKAVEALVNTGVWHLSAITGLDIPQTQETDGQIELIYHFCQKSVITSLRIRVPYGAPMAPSICKVIPAAVLYEREVVEFFGVILDGIPMRERLLLPDDWPDGVYPLRKTFHGLE